MNVRVTSQQSLSLGDTALPSAQFRECDVGKTEPRRATPSWSGAASLLSALIFSLVLAGCPRTDGNSDAGAEPECASREQCATGEVCTAQGFCTGCESSGQCRLKEACNPTSFLCELRAGYGTDCVTNSDCQAGAWCMQGLCKDRAEVNLCPGGTNAECPSGFRCNTVNTVCEEDLGCSENADCAAAEVCNTGSHACVPRCTVDTQGEICAGGEKCVNERCVQCAADAECAPGLTCDAAGRCGAGQRCYGDRDCRVPLICYLPTGACLQKPPPCVSDDNCDKEQRCEVNTGRCVPRACQPDRYEANNNISSAFSITAGRYNALTLCQGDVDYYALSLNRGDEVGVNVDADNYSENTFTTAVRDSSGRTLASGKLLVNYVAPAPQPYYVAIATSDVYQAYDVTFLVTRGTPCDDDGYEPNDTPTQATAFNSATGLDGMICPQDQDHFGVAVPAGKGVRLTLSNYNASSGLLRVCLFDGMTSLQCSDDFVPVITQTAEVVGGKMLVARVVGSLEGIRNSYTLNVEYP
ncbi:MAG: PPC domain-containing protein [Myxococcaceae bacterium]